MQEITGSMARDAVTQSSPSDHWTTLDLCMFHLYNPNGELYKNAQLVQQAVDANIDGFVENTLMNVDGHDTRVWMMSLILENVEYGIDVIFNSVYNVHIQNEKLKSIIN